MDAQPQVVSYPDYISGHKSKPQVADQAWHKRRSSVNTRNLAHDVCVATLAALAGEMADSCDTCIYLW